MKKTWFCMQRVDRCPAEKRDDGKEGARAQEADRRRGDVVVKEIRRRRVTAVPCSTGRARNAAGGTYEPLFRCGIFPRHRSHRRDVAYQMRSSLVSSRTVHGRLRLHEERYCRPVTHYLLQGLVQCGVCGSPAPPLGLPQGRAPVGQALRLSSSDVPLQSARPENMHDRTRIERCRNAERTISSKESVRADPGNHARSREAARRVDTGGRLDDRSIARSWRGLPERSGSRGGAAGLIGRYAAEQMAENVHHREPRPGHEPRAADAQRPSASQRAIPAARGFCGREHSAVLRRARERAPRRARTSTGSGSSRGSRRTGDLRPLQDPLLARSRYSRHRGKPSCDTGPMVRSTRRRCAQVANETSGRSAMGRAVPQRSAALEPYSGPAIGPSRKAWSRRHKPTLVRLACLRTRVTVGSRCRADLAVHGEEGRTSR